MVAERLRFWRFMGLSMPISFTPLPDLELLNELFEVRDGVLLYKVSPRRGMKAGAPVGCITKAGYLRTKINRKAFLVHRIVFKMTRGYDPDEVDHKSRSGADNHPDNLREANRSQNCANTRTRINSKSGVKGVCWHKSSGKWIAQINHNGRVKYLGTFIDINEAKAVYDAAALAAFGEFAHAG
jgi:hypothetical protein